MIGSSCSFAVPDDRGPGKDLLLEQVGCVSGLVFLEKVQGDACKDDDKDDGGTSDFADKHRDGRSNEEDDDEGVFEMREELEDHRALRDLGNIIGAVPVTIFEGL